mmetsp:Transcript_47897/g.93578  ORF Transcript_47897/g.93578 Transcript_47897/m.93578 type:complete len:392 (-) Transcript_47897:78-1253(-)
MSETNKNVEVVRLWQLPDDFFDLPIMEQWTAVEKVTTKAVPLEKPRRACPMSSLDEFFIVTFFLVTLGLPWVLIGCAVAASGSWATLGGVAAATAVLALHPIPHRSLNYFRSSRLALALLRYFTFECIVNRDDPIMAVFGTQAVDAPAAQLRHLPAIYLACPHGVFNYGAIAWCCISRWMSGWYQYTGGAPAMAYVPGLRYMDLFVWLVSADRRNIKAALRVPEDLAHTNRASSGNTGSGCDAQKAGGMIGMVPDGILGAFRCKSGVDELAIGGRRGLLRIAQEEGATVYATWFFGTNDMLTVVQDPWGLMERISRRLQAGFMGYYGRWGLPVPRRVAVSVVVAPHSCEKLASPSAEQLEALHSKIYGGLGRVYDRQKAFTGYPDRTLLIT